MFGQHGHSQLPHLVLFISLDYLIDMLPISNDLISLLKSVWYKNLISAYGLSTIMVSMG
jgi:hypothetical protein